MCGPLLLGLVGASALELWLLIEAGARIGAVETICLVLLTAGAGATLVHRQGAPVLARLRAGLPAREDLLHGPLLLLAALALVTPGFLSDTIGFLLLLRPFRRFVAMQAIRRFARPVASNGESVFVIRGPGMRPPGGLDEP